MSAMLVLALVSPASAQEFGTIIPMREKGSATYYVTTEILGLGAVDLMVDTGSSYTTINEETLAVLIQQQRADYISDLEGMLADVAEVYDERIQAKIDSFVSMLTPIITIFLGAVVAVMLLSVYLPIFQIIQVTH